MGLKGQYLLSGVAVACLSFASARAQTMAEPRDTSQVEEVIVTATRRAEPLQQVPLSVAAVTSEQLRQSGAITFADVGFAAANFVTAEGTSPGQFEGVVVRGIQNRAGVYVDDVLIPTTQAQNVSLSDVERIEILRGPQGTSFGANTLAGAINTITKQPSFTWTGDVNATLGNYSYYDTRAFLSGPIIPDVLAFKASAFRTSRDGFDEDTTGRDLPTIDVVGARAGLLLKATPRLSLTLSADWEHDTPRIDDFHALVPGTTEFEPDAVARNVIGRTDRDVYGGSLRINYDFGGGVKLVSITALRYLDNFAIHDEDFSTRDALTGVEPITDRDVSQEFRLTGGGDFFNWLAGAYYFDSHKVNRTHFLVGPDYPTGPDTTLGTNLSNTVFDRLESRNEALFGTVNWRFLQSWKLTLGLRYSDTRIEDSNFNSGYQPGVPALGPLVKLPTISNNRFDPSVSLAYNFAPDVMSYFRVATGYQAAGYNASLCTGGSAAQQAFCQYKPETLISYELGLKSLWLHKRLMANISIYDEEYSNLQRQEYIGSLASPYYYGNAAKAVARGVELEFRAQATSELSFDGSVGYDDTHYKSFPDATVFDFLGTTLQVDLSGRSLPFAPNWTGFVGSNYRRATPLGMLNLRAEVQYRDSYVNDDSPVNLYNIKPQTNLNLSAELTLQNGVYIAVRGRNVTDVRTVTHQSGGLSSGEYYETISEPAFVYGQIGYHF